MDDAPELERVNPGRDMKRAESVIAMNRTGRVLPPKIALVAVITMIALHAVVPLAIVVRPPVSYAGALFLATGAAMIIWSRRAFQAAGTPIRPLTESTVLICHGFYRWSRNPMYLGTVLLIAGVAILLGTLAPLLVVIVVSRSCRKASSAGKRGCWTTPSATATGHTGARSDDGCRWLS